MRKVNKNLLILGMTGAGKTVFTRRLLAVAPRAFVIDPMEDYTDGQVFRTFEDTWKFYRKHMRDDFHIIYRDERKDAPVALLDMIYHTQCRKDLPPVAVIMEEASLMSSPHLIHDITDRIYTKGRHGRISVVTVAQQMTQINTIIRDQSHQWIAFRLRRQPAEVGARFTRGDIDRMPDLETLRPGVEPLHGVHYVTDDGQPADVGGFARALLETVAPAPTDDYDTDDSGGDSIGAAGTDGADTFYPPLGGSDETGPPTDPPTEH